MTMTYLKLPQFETGSPSRRAIIKIHGVTLQHYQTNNAMLVTLRCVRYVGGVMIGNEALVLSVNLDDPSNGYASRSLKPGEFFAKNYSEGEKPFNAMLEAGWIELTGQTQRSGFVNIPACRLTKSAILK